jgi:hypothetical protein
MKLAAAFLLGVLCFYPIRAAESQFSMQDAVSLDLGSVTVYLGMTEVEALKRLSEKSYKVVQPNANSAIASAAGHFYTLKFRNGALVYADRTWTENPELIDAILGGLGSVARNSTNTCHVLHQPVSDPDVSGDRFFIVCGHRNLLVGKLRIEREIGPTVLESIGDITSD